MNTGVSSGTLLCFVLYIPVEFWNALGGKREYQTSARLVTESEDRPPRLYGCSNKTGRFIVCLRCILSALFLLGSNESACVQARGLGAMI